MKETFFLLDWKHYLGWVISALAVIGVLHLFLDLNIHPSFYVSLVVLATIIVVDSIKHFIKFQ